MRYIKKFDEISESINDTKKSIAEKFLNALLSPITILTLSNLNTGFKIQLIIDSIIKHYIEEKAEYRILDESKYDVEMPSMLDRIFKRLKLINKKMKKFPTLDIYIQNIIKYLKMFNIVNFRNREDIDYTCDKIIEYFKKKSEEEWIEMYVDKLVFNPETGKVERTGIQSRIDAARLGPQQG